MQVYDLYTASADRLEHVDAVVLATAPLPDDDLYHQLHEAGVEQLHRVGDCVAPRKLDHAIYEGYIAGRELFGESRYIDDEELYVDAMAGNSDR